MPAPPPRRLIYVPIAMLAVAATIGALALRKRRGA